jgi:histidinol-phosphate aminotransferase
MRLYGVDHLHRLNNNENPLGPPEAARKMIKEFPPPKASLYPSGDVFLSAPGTWPRSFGLDPDQFLCGNGANEVIAFAIKAFCQERATTSVTADKTFAVYEWVAEFSGFQAKLVPLNDDFGFDDEGMLDAMDQRTKILFRVQPQQPHRHLVGPKTSLRRFMDAGGRTGR